MESLKNFYETLAIKEELEILRAENAKLIAELEGQQIQRDHFKNLLLERAKERDALLAEREAMMKQEPAFEVGRHGKSGDYYVTELKSKVRLHKGMKLYASPLPAQQIPEGYALADKTELKKIHRDLDACQKVIWYAGGFDAAYCKDAQESLKLIDAMLSASKPKGDA